MKKSLLLISLIMSVITAQPGGFVPNAISFQGMLTNVDGSVYQDGDYELTFRLIRIIQGGTEQVIWEEIHTAAVSNGVFSVVLGSNTPLPQNVPGNAMLETQVGEEILVPRQPLTSVPFALRSNRAQFSEQALRSDSSGFAQTSHHSVFADTAVFALSAPTAGTAMHATYADTSMFAGQAGQAVHATYADTSMIAGQSHHSIYADTSMIAGQSHHSIYADTSMIAGQSHHSIYADTAAYVLNIPTMDTVILVEQSNHAIYADTSSFSNNTRNIYFNNNNVLVGGNNMNNDVVGDKNVILGHNSLQSNITGERNISIGYGNLNSGETGSYNYAIGLQALGNSVGDSNIAIGHSAGNMAVTGMNNLFIGHGVVAEDGDYYNSSYKLAIGMGYHDEPLIEGDFLNDSLNVNGDLKIYGDLNVTGSMTMSVASTITSSTTFNGIATIIPINTENGSVTVTIDSDQLVPGRILIIKELAGGESNNPLTIATEGIEQINISGNELSNSFTSTTDWVKIRLFCDGSNWYDF